MQARRGRGVVRRDCSCRASRRRRRRSWRSQATARGDQSARGARARRHLRGRRPHRGDAPRRGGRADPRGHRDRVKVLKEDIDGDNDAWLAVEAAKQKRAEQGHRAADGAADRAASRTARSPTSTPSSSSSRPTTRTKVKLFTLTKTSLLGKTIYGVEVSHNVAQNVGKPTFLLTGAHHAREWPTAEFTMEFIWDLLINDGTDADATNLLEKGKLIAVPVVNADGYDLSRSLQNEQKRKNCRITAGVIPTLADCTLAANVNRGIDLNRNYLPFWGGPGSSTSATASNTRGEAPGSEPEIAGMIDLLNHNPAVLAINNHTPDQRLLRVPSSSNEPDVLADQAAYQALLRPPLQEPPRLARRPVDRRLLRGVQHRRAAGLLRLRRVRLHARGDAGLQRRADVPPAVPERDRQLPRHRHALRGPDDARALLRRVQGRDRARPALGDLRHRARGREAHADQDVQRSTRASTTWPTGHQPADPRVPERARRHDHGARERASSSGT